MMWIKAGLLTFLRHVVGMLIFLGTWEWASRIGALNPIFFGRPSGIAIYLWQGLVTTGSIWLDLGYTLLGTALAFVLGSVSAVAAGLLFASFPGFHKASEPYLTLLNSMPRIALAPLFLLWFGLGLGSKIAVGFSLAFFIVLSATIAGIRGINPDHLVLSRTLGASPREIFFKVTMPSAIPVIFSGLRLALVYSLLGVVGAELIAAEHGVGQMLAYLQSNFNVNGVLGLLILLAVLGLVITTAMDRLELYLLDRE